MKSLYKVALPPIIKYVREKNGTKSDAEDCFQEAVVALVKKVKSNEFDTNFEVKNFLFVVSRNIWFNKIKKDSKMHQTDYEGWGIEDSAETSDQVMISNERSGAITQLLNSAGERCKELLVYVLFENKKLKEIAGLMNFSSEEVVKTNHYRCKQKLKEILKNDPNLLSALRV